MPHKIELSLSSSIGIFSLSVNPEKNNTFTINIITFVTSKMKQHKEIAIPSPNITNTTKIFPDIFPSVLLVPDLKLIGCPSLPYL